MLKISAKVTKIISKTSLFQKQNKFYILPNAIMVKFAFFAENNVEQKPTLAYERK